MKKKIIRKRIVSALLTVAMLVSLMPIVEPAVRVRAADTDCSYCEDFETGAVMTEHSGSGTRENKLEIETNAYLKATGLSNTILTTPEIAVKENTQYTVSYRVKVENVSGNFYFQTWGQNWTGGDYVSLTALPQPIKADTDGWQTVQGNFTVTKTSMQIFFDEAWGGSSDVYIDDITLTETATSTVVYSESFDSTQALNIRSGSVTQTRVEEEISDYSLKIAGACSYAVKTDLIRVNAEQEYVLSYRVKTENVSGNFFFYASRQESDDAGNYSTTILTTQGVQTNTDGWQTVEATFKPEKNRIQLFFEEAWGGCGDVYIDDITLKTADGSDVVYFEDFSAQKTMTVHYGTSGTQSLVPNGNHYLQITNATGYAVKTDGITIEANAEYTLSYRVKVDRVSGSCYIRVFRQEWDDAGIYSGILDTTSGITATTDGWQTVEATFTSESNHVQLFFEQAWGGSADFGIDDIVLTKVETEPTEPETTEPEATEPDHTDMRTSLSLNRVESTQWYLDASNVAEVTGEYYFATANVDGNAQKVVFEKTDSGFIIYNDFFTTQGGSVPQNIFEIPAQTVLYQFDPNVSWNDAVVGGQWITLSQTLSVEAVGNDWYEKAERTQIGLHYNRVDVSAENTWYLDIDGSENVSGTFFFGTIRVDGADRKLVLEKKGDCFVIYGNYFNVYQPETTTPQSTLVIPEGTVFYQFDPNTSWSIPVSGGQQLAVSEALSVAFVGNAWFEIDGEAVPAFVVQQWNILLGDNLNVNFYVQMDSTVADSAEMQITVGTGTAACYKVSQAQKDDAGAYIFTAELTAAQMTDAIKLQLIHNGEAVHTCTYTVEQYAKKLLADNTASTYHPIVKEMLNYGAKAQLYFAHNTAHLAGADLDLTDAGKYDLSAAEPSEMTINGQADGVTFYGASLLFQSKNTVRFYFMGSTEGVTVTVGAEDLAISRSNQSLWYVDVAGINPQQLDQSITAIVNGTLYVTYSPLNYMVRMNEKGSDSLKALLNALYSYHKAAKALYAGVHTSDDTVYFETSDEEMTAFLNDFFQRHMGYVDASGTDYSVSTLKAGLDTSNTFYQEWMSKTLFTFNSATGLETDRYNGQKSLLENIPVDEYGYVWCDDDEVRDNDAEEADGLHRMGWPFPTSVDYNSNGYSTSWTFNGDGKDSCDWSSNFGAAVDAEQKMMVGSFTDQSSITYEVKMPMTSGGITPYFAPWLEIDLRMALENPENVADVYIWFTNSRSEDFSEEKCVSASEWAAIKYSFTEDYQHLLYFPMYAHPSWGEWKNPNDNSHKIYRLKIEIRAKENTTISGSCALNSVRSDFDTRHANNQAIYLTSLYETLKYTGDVEYLVRNLTNARKAMNYYMQMFDEDRSLIVSSYLVGHDGDKSGDCDGFDILGLNQDGADAMERASALGNGYYDATYMPEYDFHTNLYFYKGLQSMIALEQYVEENYDELLAVAEKLGVSIDKADATIRTAKRAATKFGAKADGEEVLGQSAYGYDASQLQNIADKVLAALREETNDETMTGFYHAATGRFAAGYDVNTGELYDFGYTQYNLEAIYLGIATDAQSKSIMDWISGARIVESDKTDDNGNGNGQAGASGIGGSVGDDIYFFGFAPRSTTVNQTSPSVFNGVVDADRSDNMSVFGIDEVQYGGAFLWTSFYDILARIQVYGEDNAYDRLKGIQQWYSQIYDYFNSEEHQSFRNPEDSDYNANFYYDYYYNNPFQNGDEDVYLLLQGGQYGTDSERGGNASGVMGIDSEFAESILLIASVPYGFFGIDSTDGRNLKLTPALPSELTYWKVANMMFSDVKYDLTIMDGAVRIENVRGEQTGLTVTVTLDIENGQSVYVNGAQATGYSVSDGQAVITLPLQNSIIEVK